MPLIKNAPEQPIKTAHYPDIHTALIRRERARQKLAARVMLFLALAGLAYKIFSGNDFGWVVFFAFLVGFIVTCFVASKTRPV